MASANNKHKKDQIYPSDTSHTVARFDTDATILSGTVVKGSKVASLVNAINAKVQEQSSPRRGKSDPVIKRTSSAGRTAAYSIETKIGKRINSSDCLFSSESHSQALNPHSKYEVHNGFGSDHSVDDFDDVPTISRMMTRSLGRNEFIGMKSVRSPTRTLLREIPKGKVESNPFFQQDRQLTDMKQPWSSIKPTTDFTSKCSVISNSVSTNGVRCDSLSSRHESSSEVLSIKTRIQLWSEKERATSQQQVHVERRKSAHFPVSSCLAEESDSVLQCHVCLSSSASTCTSHGISTKQRSNSMSSLCLETQTELENVPTNVNVGVTSAGLIDNNGISFKAETQSPEGGIANEEIRGSKEGSSPQSSPQPSPQVSPKGSPKGIHKDSPLDVPKGSLHKLSSKLMSPRFLRKKRDSFLKGEEKNLKIACRSSRKRKAFKSKLHTTLSNPPDAEMCKPSAGNSISNIDDDVFAVEGDINLQTSVNAKGYEMVITKNCTESLHGDPHKILKSCNQTPMTAMENLEQKDDGAESLPLSCLCSERGCQQPEAKCCTISGDVHEIISSFGSASDSETNMCGTSHPCGSGESSSDDGPTQSNLDKKVSPSRSALKRRASDNMKSLLSPQKAIVGVRKGSTSPSEDDVSGVIATPLVYADAVWDRDAQDTDELTFKVGDVIEILDMTDDVWWQGSVQNAVGWFPASFVRLRIGQESDSDDAQSLTFEDILPTEGCTSESSDTVQIMHILSNSIVEIPSVSDDFTQSLPRTLPSVKKLQGNSVKRRMTIRRKDSAPSLPHKLTPTEVRAKVVEEILNTERDYVHNLEDIIEGFLNRCKEYSTLFDAEKVETIFSNVEQIYKFQRDFLRELESKVDHDRMDCSEIGDVFVLNKHEFAVYSQYCNNHPHAVNEMNQLQQNEQYTLFFESCRLLRNLQDISLEGFLLTPVQKICKYPLQLSELLKYTDRSHPDYDQVVSAQHAMKEVAIQINEQKRRMENIGKIGLWQMSIDSWKGPDILERSTELIHSGELHKISKGHSQERHFFLFDRQLVYCKKEIGGKLSYKGRLDMEACQVADMPDGSGNTPVKNAWRMNNIHKDKWYIIYAKTLKIKKEWMDAFQQERKRVQDDSDKGFHVSMKMKRAAVSLVESTSENIKRRKSFTKRQILLTESVDTGIRQRIDSSSTGKKLAVSGYTSAQPKKQKGNKRK